MINNMIFFSYRRVDVKPYVLALKIEIENRLSAAPTFIDSFDIAPSRKWSNAIELAIKKSKVIIPVIGHNWGGLMGNVRRIDNEDDFLRKEVAFILKNKKSFILPVFIGGANRDSIGNIPGDVKNIMKIQGVNISISEWDIGVDVLIKNLEEQFSFRRKNINWEFPIPHPITSRKPPILWSDLDEKIRNDLYKWSLELLDDDINQGVKYFELTRIFKFNKFKDAVKFINRISDYSDKANHHPRITNLWTSVKIYLSTWDAGHKITALDIKSAQAFDVIYDDMLQ